MATEITPDGLVIVSEDVCKEVIDSVAKSIHIFSITQMYV